MIDRKTGGGRPTIQLIWNNNRKLQGHLCLKLGSGLKSFSAETSGRRRSFHVPGCPRVELLRRQQEELPTEILDQQNQAKQLQEAATRDPPIGPERSEPALKQTASQHHEQVGQIATSEAAAV